MYILCAGPMILLPGVAGVFTEAAAGVGISVSEMAPFLA